MLTRDMIMNYTNETYVKEIEEALETAVKQGNFKLTPYCAFDCVLTIDCKWPDGRHMVKVRENLENSGEFYKVKMGIYDDKLEVRLTFMKDCGDPK